MNSPHVHTKRGYQDAFKTVGAIRCAAFNLAEQLRGTRYGKLATELHDSICVALPQDPDMPVSELHPDEVTP